MKKRAKKKIRVAVICGGPSSEREVSLRSGANIAKSLAPKYDAFTVELPRKIGVIPGILARKLAACDVAFIALHGPFGEDGRVQAILEFLGVPYTCSGVLASAIGMNKIRTFELVRSARIKTPSFFALHAPPLPKVLHTRITKTFGYPCVVRPNESGSSIGVSIVKKRSELAPALRKAFKEGSAVLVDRYIRGRELTCGVLGNTGQTELRALPAVEIIPPPGRFFDYDAKYFSKKTREVCPAPIPKRVERRVQETAKRVHALLGCDGLTRSDFILGKNGTLYFLEINTIPGMTSTSLCPKEANAIGWSFGKFLEKIVKLALLKKKRSPPR